MQWRPTPLLCCLALLLLNQRSLAAKSSLISPSGEVLIAPSANRLEQVESPDLAPSPGATPSQVQADCLSEDGVFYGSDFLSTIATSASSPAECCAACKAARDCTVWNWCGKQEGCPLPPNLATAGNHSKFEFQACIWKPRPITFAGTLPQPPTANHSADMAGWTSGIPINGTLLPALQGFELTPGIEMEYSEESDFFCDGSSTTKPVCQLYGSAKGGAAACFSSLTCRGFQICWAFPTDGDYNSQQGIIRLKAGDASQLNVSKSLQNPYCSVYVLKANSAEAPQAGTEGVPVWDGSNITALSAAASTVRGRRLLQAPAVNNVTGQSGTMGGGGASMAGTDMPAIINLGAPDAQNVSQPSPSSPPASSTATAPAPAGGLQAFENIIFNYSQCYADSPIIHVSVQQMQFPLQGPRPTYSIHTWTEVPFRNSGDVCCAFQDVNDFFLDLESGSLAKTLPMFVATDARLTSGPALKNYDTKPVSVVSPLVYIPAGQMNNPSVGQGRQFTFPRTNGSDYIAALELLYFSLSQVALGNRFCTPGNAQLGPTVNLVGELLSMLSEDSETPGDVPAELEFQSSTAPNPDGSSENTACIVERGAVYEGDLLRTLRAGTPDDCCKACWLYYDPDASTACDIWTLDSQGSCSLKNSSLASDFQVVPAQHDSSSFISGRRTAVLPITSTNPFRGEDT